MGKKDVNGTSCMIDLRRIYGLIGIYLLVLSLNPCCSNIFPVNALIPWMADKAGHGSFAIAEKFDWKSIGA